MVKPWTFYKKNKLAYEFEFEYGRGFKMTNETIYQHEIDEEEEEEEAL